MLQKLAWVFGVIFILIGVIGFVPAAAPGGLLLGIFSVDSLHNTIHLLSGVIVILAALGSASYARLYFKVFGIIYALVAILGFVFGGEVFGMMMNTADNLLHVVIAVVALWAGFGTKDSMPMQGGVGM